MQEAKQQIYKTKQPIALPPGTKSPISSQTPVMEEKNKRKNHLDNA